MVANDTVNKCRLKKILGSKVLMSSSMHKVDVNYYISYIALSCGLP